MSAPLNSRYVRLAPHALLRRLEKPFLYSKQSDDLYELSEDGFLALGRCDGSVTLAEAGLEESFAAYCLEEGLIELSDGKRPVRVSMSQASPSPSLRYLELQVTRRCNLSCRHCYLGDAKNLDLSVDQIAAICREFEDMGGLRLLVSGGEPLAHPKWDEINGLLEGVALRKVLLTNGLLLNKKRLAKLNVDEIQLSLDGMRAGHEAVRGPNTFDLALACAWKVADAGFELSVATQAHAKNLCEFDEMEVLMKNLGVREWGVDAPCLVGRLAANSELCISPGDAAKAMSHGFGGAYHGGSDGMACGLHLATVGADGTVAQCGFYFDKPLGNVGEGLQTCWTRRKPLSLESVPKCQSCEAVEDCAGGCRFRAPSLCEPDTVMCGLFGVG